MTASFLRLTLLRIFTTHSHSSIRCASVMTRPQTAGPDSGPQPPFPIRLSGKIITGFGRGSKELGIPTANIPIEGLSVGGHENIESGVYLGWAGLCRSTDPKAAHSANKHVDHHHIREKMNKAISVTVDTLAGSNTDPYSATELKHKDDKDTIEVFPAVLSIGYNPFYANTKRTVEVHLIHQFSEDFYGAMLNLSILAFIRGEENYDSKQALIDDIKTDIVVAGKSLERESYAKMAKDPYLIDFEWDPEKGK